MTAGGLGFPHLGDPAAAAPRDEPIPRDLRVTPQDLVVDRRVTSWSHGPPLEDADRGLQGVDRLGDLLGRSEPKPLAQVAHLPASPPPKCAETPYLDINHN